MLEVVRACKTFNPGTPDEVRALNHVDLTVDPGDFVVVIGSNGSGKTTLQNAVAGSCFLDSGKIRLNGVDITQWPEHRRAGLIGRVFQDPFSGTAPSMTVAENIALAARRGLPRGLDWAIHRRAKEEIRDRLSVLNMGLEDRLETPMGALSGGQRQAITLLMATWRQPALLLLDEHTAALDPKSAEKIIQLTKSIIESGKLTTMMVTHSMLQAAHLGNRLIMTHRGKIVHDIGGRRKQRVRPNDLLDLFEDIRRVEQLDETAAEMLRRNF